MYIYRERDIYIYKTTYIKNRTFEYAGKLALAICQGGGNCALRSVRGGEVVGWLIIRTSVSHLGLHGVDKTYRFYPWPTSILLTELN